MPRRRRVHLSDVPLHIVQRGHNREPKKKRGQARFYVEKRGQARFYVKAWQ